MFRCGNLIFPVSRHSQATSLHFHPMHEHVAKPQFALHETADNWNNVLIGTTQLRNPTARPVVLHPPRILILRKHHKKQKCRGGGNVTSAISSHRLMQTIRVGVLRLFTAGAYAVHMVIKERCVLPVVDFVAGVRMICQDAVDVSRQQFFR